MLMVTYVLFDFNFLVYNVEKFIDLIAALEVI